MDYIVNDCSLYFYIYLPTLVILGLVACSLVTSLQFKLEMVRIKRKKSQLLGHELFVRYVFHNK